VILNGAQADASPGADAHTRYEPGFRSGTVKLARATPFAAWDWIAVVGQVPAAAVGDASEAPLKVTATGAPIGALHTIACTAVPGPPEVVSRISTSV